MLFLAALQTEPTVHPNGELEEFLIKVAAGARDALAALYRRTRTAV